ncbi:MAG: polyprenyl synthetase family protein [Clostridia bacterium]|nr:polyprenyl synthetase family protein [Clostridia bacterium]
MAEFHNALKKYRETIEARIDGFCAELDCRPRVLREGMIYSLKSGGKRIRPVIMLACADMLGVERERVLDFALAIELIHTYSLIHDDLPEMDNDDFRRGRPSNHAVFGPGNALLAGDGLLNSAYGVILKACNEDPSALAAANWICDAAGIYGMIGGQSADLLHENDSCRDEQILDFIYSNKTGKLITAACVTPCLMGGGYFLEMNTYGERLGKLFQLTDDILDVEGSREELGKTPGKDAKAGKYTAVSLYGIANSKKKVLDLQQDCLSALEGIDRDTWFFCDLANYIAGRTN